MRERGGCTRLKQEALAHAGRTIFVVQQLDRDLAVQPLVPRAEDDAHAAAAQQRQDLVWTKPLPCLGEHPCRCLACLR